MYTRRAVLLAKIETEYGTDPTPTALANAILVSKPTVKPVFERAERNIVSSTISPLAATPVGITVDVDFDTELRFASAAGAVPDIGHLLRACGLDQTVDAGVSVTYSPVSSDFESCTLYVYLDGIVHKISGCRGNVKFVGEVKKYGIFSFTFRGKYAGPEASALPTATYDAVDPEIIRYATTSLKLSGEDAITPVITKFELDLKNELFNRDDMTTTAGVKEIMIQSRKPSGSIDPEVVTIATKNFWSEFRNKTLNLIKCGIGGEGVEASNRFQITIPTAAWDDLAYAEKGPLATFNLPFICQYDEGDDELSIMYR